MLNSCLYININKMINKIKIKIEQLYYSIDVKNFELFCYMLLWVIWIYTLFYSFSNI